MATLQNENGPAPLAGDPSRGSNNPSQDIKNMNTNTTAAGARQDDFPMPHISQGPEDDMRDAMALFDLLDYYFDEGTSRGIPKDTVCDIVVAMSIARSLLQPIRRYLIDDMREDSQSLYLSARRAEILSGFKGVAA